MYETFSKIAFLGRRRRVFARIVALSGAQPGDRALDVGCGAGYLARLLAAAVGPDGRVTGVDPSSPAINYARRRDPGNCSFAVGVAQDLDLPDSSFDVVTSTLAVHHILDALLQDVGDRMQRRAQGSQARRHGRVGLLVADLLCLYREQPREVEIGGSPWSVPVPPGALLRL